LADGAGHLEFALKRKEISDGYEREALAREAKANFRDE
jgi:hypothetical protein